jgi:guanine deaminase
MASKNQVFLGTFIHSKKLDELEYLHNTAVFVDAAGKIVRVERDCDANKAKETVLPTLGWAVDDVSIVEGKEAQFFFPGFIGK